MLARVNNELTLMPWRNLAELQNEFVNSFAELDDFWQQHNCPRIKVENNEKDVKVIACLPGYDEKTLMWKSLMISSPSRRLVRTGTYKQSPLFAP